MSLTLLIFRHAKSDFDAPSDHERILTDHGIQQAKFMGELLNEKGIYPDLVICSSADRAKITMNLAMEAGEWGCDSNITDALYNTTTEVMYQLISQFIDLDKTIMLVGHEPTWSELAKSLTGENLSFNAAGMCCIKFDTPHWSGVQAHSGTLSWYESP
jgi:phosphohistidine phosphatase